MAILHRVDCNSPNLFLNTGHGGLGWPWPVISLHVLAQMIGGGQPAIDVSELAFNRDAPS